MGERAVLVPEGPDKTQQVVQALVGRPALLEAVLRSLRPMMVGPWTNASRNGSENRWERSPYGEWFEFDVCVRTLGDSEVSWWVRLQRTHSDEDTYDHGTTKTLEEGRAAVDALLRQKGFHLL